jgi:hypothetical protein
MDIFILLTAGDVKTLDEPPQTAFGNTTINEEIRESLGECWFFPTFGNKDWGVTNQEHIRVSLQLPEAVFNDFWTAVRSGNNPTSVSFQIFGIGLETRIIPGCATSFHWHLGNKISDPPLPVVNFRYSFMRTIPLATKSG